MRSWEMELKRRSLSSMKRRMRCCMMLKARVAATISEAPSSLRDGWSMSLPRLTAALARRRRGRVCQRTSMKVKKQRKTVIRAMKRTWLLGMTVSSSVM